MTPNSATMAAAAAPQPQARAVAMRHGPVRGFADFHRKTVIGLCAPAPGRGGTSSSQVPGVAAAIGVIAGPVGAGPFMETTTCSNVAGTTTWRLAFRLGRSGLGPARLKAYLRRDGRALTEIWPADVWVKRTTRS